MYQDQDQDQGIYFKKPYQLGLTFQKKQNNIFYLTANSGNIFIQIPDHEIEQQFFVKNIREHY